MCHGPLEEGAVCDNVVYPPQKFCSNCGKRLSFVDNFAKMINPLSEEKNVEKERLATASSNSRYSLNRTVKGVKVSIGNK
jgi:hypothetical protein